MYMTKYMLHMTSINQSLLKKLAKNSSLLKSWKSAKVHNSCTTVKFGKSAKNLQLTSLLCCIYQNLMTLVVNFPINFYYEIIFVGNSKYLPYIYAQQILMLQQIQVIMISLITWQFRISLALSLSALIYRHIYKINY